MALTKLNDVAFYEAGHALLSYLFSDIIEIHHVTIDPEYSKTFDIHSDGGVLFKHLINPENLNQFEIDLLCLSFLAGLAADLINEHNGTVSENFFYSPEFSRKIQHHNYQGDMIIHSNFFNQIEDQVKIPRSEYNYLSLKLLLTIFSDEKIQEDLINLRNLLEKSKTLEGKTLRSYLDGSYIILESENLERYKREPKEIILLTGDTIAFLTSAS
ncbi:hypothetical protein K0U91_06680 [Chryseobacterium chendengshani]|uniref:hypothetical protein n=1 Tax=Chryseobacterium sp. LJ668 TaxID=2864040 RepID=UPI001C692C98|nr:hypothetical protein [Chryseobacterium sp. LJ668]MBW8522151.1 hypothetical protein [Chryseobacterium sp. LJ668]QYK17798.1 hypothetical protein K0U91_06680 [Chryseobacterium sp. LJ668]